MHVIMRMGLVDDAEYTPHTAHRTTPVVLAVAEYTAVSRVLLQHSTSCHAGPQQQS
jgi:hypothetical protein